MMYISNLSETRAGTESDAIGKSVVVMGPAEMILASGEKVNLSQDSLIYSHSKIKTGPNSRVKLFFNDNSVVDLGTRTEFEVEEFKMKTVEERNVAFAMIAGKIRSKITNPLSGSGKFQIRTRTAAMGVRGTEFIVVSEASPIQPKNIETQITVVEGKLEVTDRSGGIPKSYPVAAGQQFNSTTKPASIDSSHSKTSSETAKVITLSKAQIDSVNSSVKIVDKNFQEPVKVQSSNQKNQDKSSGDGKQGSKPAGSGTSTSNSTSNASSSSNSTSTSTSGTSTSGTSTSGTSTSGTNSSGANSSGTNSSQNTNSSSNSTAAGSPTTADPAGGSNAASFKSSGASVAGSSTGDSNVAPQSSANTSVNASAGSGPGTGVGTAAGTGTAAGVGTAMGAGPITGAQAAPPPLDSSVNTSESTSQRSIASNPSPESNSAAVSGPPSGASSSSTSGSSLILQAINNVENAPPPPPSASSTDGNTTTTSNAKAPSAVAPPSFNTIPTAILPPPPTNLITNHNLKVFFSHK